MKFGDIVINKVASIDNPLREGIFVKELPKTYQFTDGHGLFWDTYKDCAFEVVKENKNLKL